MINYLKEQRKFYNKKNTHKKEEHVGKKEPVNLYIVSKF